MSASDGLLTQTAYAVAWRGDGYVESAHGCRVVTVEAGRVWDVVPAEVAGVTAFARTAIACEVYRGAGTPAALAVALSPVTYPAPAAGPAVRLTFVEAPTATAYDPTVSVAGAASGATLIGAYWDRAGDVVSVELTVSFDATGTGPASLDVVLPVEAAAGSPTASMQALRPSDVALPTPSNPGWVDVSGASTATSEWTGCVVADSPYVLSARLTYTAAAAAVPVAGSLDVMVLRATYV